jgi:hypothetical protein
MTRNPEVVAVLEERIPGAVGLLRTYGRGVLGEIKRPESEVACLRLLGRTASIRERTEYASCLYHLCASTPEAFGAVAAMVLTGRYDPVWTSLDDALLTLGTMLGWEPDDDTWEARPRPDRREHDRTVGRRRDRSRTAPT